MFGSKPLRIRFDEADEFIRVYNGIRYLVLFGPEKCDAIYNRIRYLITQKALVHMFFLIIMQKSKLTLHNFVILIKSVLVNKKITIITIYF